MADKAAPKAAPKAGQAGQAGQVPAKRGRGRPRTDPLESLAHPVLVRFPGPAFALLEAEAEERGESLAATARDIILDWFTSRAGEGER